MGGTVGLLVGICSFKSRFTVCWNAWRVFRLRNSLTDTFLFPGTFQPPSAWFFVGKCCSAEVSCSSCAFDSFDYFKSVPIVKVTNRSPTNIANKGLETRIFFRDGNKTVRAENLRGMTLLSLLFTALRLFVILVSLMLDIKRQRNCIFFLSLLSLRLYRSLPVCLNFVYSVIINQTLWHNCFLGYGRHKEVERGRRTEKGKMEGKRERKRISQKHFFIEERKKVFQSRTKMT